MLLDLVSWGLRDDMLLPVGLGPRWAPLDVLLGPAVSTRGSGDKVMAVV